MIKEWILIGIIILLLIKLILIKRELRGMSIQLQDYNKLAKYKKIDINLIDKEVEKLAQSINEQINVVAELQIKHKKSKEELRRMIASISHDLRTPLTSIIGYIQVLRSNELSEARKVDYLETTYRRAKDLQGLIADFFTLSLVESPDYEMELEYLNLSNILCEILANYYDRFVEKELVPQVDMPQESVRIIADSTALKRVLENLLSNMIKYAQGEVNIRLKVEEEKVRLMLINEAGGLTGQDVEQMFNRFYTADSSRGVNGGNTGLGLAIVKELMQKMQGEITSYLDEDKLYIECAWKEVQ